jgi:hypothetical protein
LRGIGGTGVRDGNEYYYSFLDYLFEKNQQSAFPTKREEFYNVVQQFWNELEIRIDKEGLEQVYKSMKSYVKNK